MHADIILKAKQDLASRKVIFDIQLERMYQDEQWGGPEHDDEHTIFDFKSFINKQLLSVGYPSDNHVSRKALVNVAALAVAAIESIDRRSSQ